MAAKTQHVDLGKKGSFTLHKGALHRKLGIPEGTKIPEKRLESALHSRDTEEAKEARSAKGLRAMHHGKRSYRKSSRR